MNNIKAELAKFGLGDHLCCIYRDKQEQFSVLVPYIQLGLENHEKCFYIIEESTKEEVLAELKKANIDIEAYLQTKQFEFLTKEDSYLKGGSFDPDKMIALLKETEANALKDGYAGLRVTGEMTWVFSGLPGVERIIEYEAKLNLFFPTSKATAVCQYHESRFKPEILIDVIHTHPTVVIHGQLCLNPYYMPPEEMIGRLKGVIPIGLYDRISADLIARAEIELSRRQAEERLRSLQEEQQIMLDHVPAWIYYKDKENRFIRVNSAFAEIMGMSKEELAGKSLFDLYPKEQADAFWRDDKEVLASGRPKTNIVETIAIKNEQRWVQTEKLPYRNSTGEIVGILGFTVDITERRRLEAELREKMNEYKLISDAAIGRELKMIEQEKELEKLKQDQAQGA